MLAAERRPPAAAAALGRDASNGGALAGLPPEHASLGNCRALDAATLVRLLSLQHFWEHSCSHA